MRLRRVIPFTVSGLNRLSNGANSYPFCLRMDINYFTNLLFRLFPTVSSEVFLRDILSLVYTSISVNVQLIAVF